VDAGVDRDRAAALEEGELAAMRSIVDAAAPDLARRLGLRYAPGGRAGAVVATGCDVPLLNRAIGLGLLTAADEATIDRVVGLWAGTGLTLSGWKSPCRAATPIGAASCWACQSICTCSSPSSAPASAAAATWSPRTSSCASSSRS
jgi:hypothetical protein